MSDLTEHIKLTPDTKAKLDALKVTPRETYEDVVKRLLKGKVVKVPMP